MHPYYNDGTREGIKKALAYLLSPNDNVNLYNNPYFNFKPEMSDDASIHLWFGTEVLPFHVLETSTTRLFNVVRNCLLAS